MNNEFATPREPAVVAGAPRAINPRPVGTLQSFGAGELFDGSDSLIDDGLMRSNWAVPWSDLMMTMFVLFAALLAVQALQNRVKKPEPQPQPYPQVVEREKIVKQEVPTRAPSFEPLMQVNVLARSQEAVRETNLQNAEIVLLDDQSVKVSVQGPTFFGLGKADLRPEVQQFLDRLAQIIKQTPYDIHVVGHTDDKPINTAAFPSNWELSLVRASHVARYLMKSGGIAPSRFVVMGRGEYEPTAANADDESRALNRRVEIIITRDEHKGKERNRQ